MDCLFFSCEFFYVGVGFVEIGGVVGGESGLAGGAYGGGDRSGLGLEGEVGGVTFG